MALTPIGVCSSPRTAAGDGPTALDISDPPPEIAFMNCRPGQAPSSCASAATVEIQIQESDQ
jgi:hypothetical protein